jgi:Fe-S-cluster containining protein
LAPFSKSEYKAVRRTAKRLGITLVKVFIHDQPYYLPRSLARLCDLPPEQINPEKISCPFLGKDKSDKYICLVYDLRPEVCRLFGTHPGKSPRLVCPNQKKKDKK